MSTIVAALVEPGGGTEQRANKRECVRERERACVCLCLCVYLWECMCKWACCETVSAKSFGQFLYL